MVMFWYKLVKSGTISIDAVPQKYRDEVERMIKNEQ